MLSHSKDTSNFQDERFEVDVVASISLLIPRNKLLCILDEQLIYLVKQLFGKAHQRRCVYKFCSITAFGTGTSVAVDLAS